jgi:hypothetical protein
MLGMDDSCFLTLCHSHIHICTCFACLNLDIGVFFQGFCDEAKVAMTIQKIIKVAKFGYIVYI